MKRLTQGFYLKKNHNFISSHKQKNKKILILGKETPILNTQSSVLTNLSIPITSNKAPFFLNSQILFHSQILFQGSMNVYSSRCIQSSTTIDLLHISKDSTRLFNKKGSVPFFYKEKQSIEDKFEDSWNRPQKPKLRLYRLQAFK